MSLPVVSEKSGIERSGIDGSDNDGKEGTLGRALKSAHIPVDVAAAGNALTSADALDRYRAPIRDASLSRLAERVDHCRGNGLCG